MMTSVWYKLGMYLPEFYDNEYDIAYLKNQDVLIPLNKYDTKISDLMKFYLTHFKKIRSEILKSKQPYKRQNYSDVLLPFRGLFYLACGALFFIAPLVHLFISLLALVASPLTAAYKYFEEPKTPYKKHFRQQGKEVFLLLAPTIIYFSIIIRGIFDLLYTPVAWWRISSRNKLTKDSPLYVEENKGVQRLLKKGEAILAKSNEPGSGYSMELIIGALELKCSKDFYYSSFNDTSTLSKRYQQFRNPDLQSVITEFHRVNYKKKAEKEGLQTEVRLKFDPACDRTAKLSEAKSGELLNNATKFLAKFR